MELEKQQPLANLQNTLKIRKNQSHSLPLTPSGRLPVNNFHFGQARIIKHAEGADAAAVVFDGISSAKSKNTDVLIVDTAGRLHTKTNLMEELKKINKVIDREYPEAQKLSFIVLDATTGQNALSQITAFNEFVPIDGIVLTKLDGTAKGGVVVAIEKELKKPVVFVGTGESVEDIDEFNAENFVNELF